MEIFHRVNSLILWVLHIYIFYLFVFSTLMPLREISVTKEGSKDIVAINNVIYNNFDLSKLPFLQYLKVDMKNAFSHIKHDEKLGRITSYTVHPSSFNP